MTVNYTTNLALGQPVTGTESGTWGDDVNNAVTSYLDIAIAGGLAITVTTADVTLTITQGTSVATNIGSTTAQYAILNVSGAMTAARNLIVPSSSRIYLINNNTTGGFALTVKGSATSGVTLVNGEKAHVFWNGTDYAKMSNASGGAGVFSSITNSGLTSGRVVYSTTGGLETDSANLTFNGTTLTANTIGAFTLSGTIAGGGNQINNVIIGTTTPLAGAFTTLAASGAVTLSGGTANGVTYLNASKVLTSGSALTFDGTNLGIGTTAPNSKLQIVSGATAQATFISSTATPAYSATAYNGANAILALVSGSASGALNGIRMSQGGSSELLFGGVQEAGGAGAFVFQGYTGSAYAERMRIDSSGNLGIGVTPSAWTNSFGVIQGLGGWSISNTSASNSADFLSNAYRSGGANSFVYLGTANATRYQQALGQHVWYTSPSGTAGNAITFTQAMTLDASGNLGLGTTLPGSKLEVVGDIQQPNASYLKGKNSAGTATRLFGLNASNTLYIGSIDADHSGGTLFVKNGVSQMTLDSSGNLGIGTTTTNALVNSNSLALNVTSGYEIINHISGSVTGSTYVYFGYNAGVIGSIVQSGTTAVLYNVTSDQRLKENIQDAASASSLIDAIQVRQFNWKTDNTRQRYGFIAQELVTVAPEAVHQPADPEEMMAVDYSKLVPMLVKEIQSLRKRLTALEST